MVLSWEAWHAAQIRTETNLMSKDTGFETQDEITAKISATIGDNAGIVTRASMANIRGKRPQSLGTYECWLRLVAYYDAVTPEGHRVVRDCAERAIDIEPDSAVGWLTFGYMVMDELRWGFNPQPDSMERSILAFRQALEMEMSRSMLKSRGRCRSPQAVRHPGAANPRGRTTPWVEYP